MCVDVHKKGLVAGSDNVEGGGAETKSVIEDLSATMLGSAKGAELQSRVPLLSWSFFSALVITLKSGKAYKNLLVQLTVKSGFQDT